MMQRSGLALFTWPEVFIQDPGKVYLKCQQNSRPSGYFLKDSDKTESELTEMISLVTLIHSFITEPLFIHQRMTLQSRAIGQGWPGTAGAQDYGAVQESHGFNSGTMLKLTFSPTIFILKNVKLSGKLKEQQNEHPYISSRLIKHQHFAVSALSSPPFIGLLAFVKHLSYLKLYCRDHDSLPCVF